MYARLDVLELVTLYGILSRAQADAYGRSTRGDYTSFEHDRWSGLWMELRIESFAVLDQIATALRGISKAQGYAYTTAEVSHWPHLARYLT